MELVQLKKEDNSSGRESETDRDESALSIHSGSVAEIPRDQLDNKSLEVLGDVPGKPSLADSNFDSSSIKTTTVLDDEGSDLPKVVSLKKYQKFQSNEDLRQRKQRFLRNKVAPSADLTSEPERPSSAPPNRSRLQIHPDINTNRPMTAAPRFIVPPLAQLEKEVDIKAALSKQSINEKEIVSDDNESVKENSHAKPLVSEIAYIPYEYAQAMISRIMNDMNAMKANHVSIISRIEQQYQQMEEQTQKQFTEHVSQLKDRHKKRLDHFRHVIEVLHAELQSTGSIRAEAIQNLKEKNKELALERQKMQRELTSSRIAIVSASVEKKIEEDEKKSVASRPVSRESILSDEQQGIEGKIVEDSKETEKSLIVDVPEPGLDASVAAAAAAIEAKDETRLDVPEDSEKITEEAEEPPDVVVEDERERESDIEKEESEEEDDEDVSSRVVVAPVMLEDAEELKDKDQAKTPGKPSPVKKKSALKATPSQKRIEIAPSADQAALNKQQALLATKQAKRVKELERQLESEKKRLEQSRKSAKTTEAELTTSKTEISNLQKVIAEQKAELTKLQEAAGAGTIALQELPVLKEEIKTLSSENQSLVANYNSERVLRKKYYNMVEDMKGKIRVYCRVRPLSSTEKANKNQSAVQTPDEYTVKIAMNRGGVKEFQFDQIFSESASQEGVFEDTNSLIQSAVDGYNVCIFAYGQTGSGKTYTMIGDNKQQQPGIAPRAFNRIFDIASKNKKKFTFKISCYMLELYNEKLVDLLSVGKDDNARLDIKKDNKGMVMVQGTEILDAESSEELFGIFQKGSANRHVASTKMNDDSSRSHLVIGVVIESTNLTSGAVTRGKLSLVDLAGSERVAKTGATAQQLKEANSINKSLSALGDVISALSSEQSFIPYRNNKLTMLMQDSLGGNAKTLMFVNISPADYNSDESAISLTYASRVKLIKNDATKMADSKEVARLKQIIAKLKAGEDVDV